MEKKQKENVIQLAVFTVALILSAIKPFEFSTWAMEAAIPIAATIFLIVIYRKVTLSRTAYWLLLAFFLIHLYAAHYSYSATPIGNWFQETFSMARNNYDRVVHFLFGFLLVMIVREFLIRTTPLKNSIMLFTLSTCVIGTLGVIYELVEWVAALIFDPDGGGAFLGAQGDIWDAQWDLFLALLGAILGQWIFRKLYMRIMKQEGCMEVYNSENTCGFFEGLIKG